MAKPSFIIHIDSLDVIDDLTNDQAGELFRAIKAYQRNEEIDLSGIVKIAFSPFKNQFIRDEEKYKKTCERRRESGSKGGSNSKRRGIVKDDDVNSFYILKCYNDNEQFIKAGITLNNLSRRYSGQKSLPYEWEILTEFICETSESILLERALRSEFDSYEPQIKFGGYTECYMYSDVVEILRKVSKVSKPKQTEAKQAESKNKKGSKKEKESKNKKGNEEQEPLSEPKKISNAQEAFVASLRIIELFNQYIPDLPKVIKLTDKRKGQLKKLSKDIQTEKEWFLFFQKINESDFLMGRKTDWSANFDWIINPANSIKIMEGNYDNKSDFDDNQW